MSRSFIAGSVAGAALSVVALASLSLLATPGGTNAPVDDVVQAETPDTAAEPAAPATATETQTAGGAPADADATVPTTGAGESTRSAASAPAAAIIDVPTGSEFARPKADGETVLPGTEAAVDAEAAPATAPPATEPVPELADRAPAAPPQNPATAPETAAEPPAEAEPTPTAPAAEADTEIALATEAVPAPPAAEADTAPAVGQTAAAEPQAAPEPPAPAAPAAVPATPPTAEAESSAQDQGTAVADAQTQPAPVETGQATIPSQSVPVPDTATAPPAPDAAQTPVVDPLAEGDDAPGPVPDPEADSGMPLTPPPGEAPGDEGADGQPAADKGKPPAPDAKFIKVAPSQKTEPEVQELALNTENAGVKVNRLPTVGSSAAAPAAVLDGPLQKFAASFDNADAKPILAIVLIDKGVAAGGLDPSALAALPFPVTIALDPTRADAAEAEKTYREAGSEVAILAANLPQRATPADLEVAYQGYVKALPESVALLGGPTSEIQRSSLAAQHVAALLAADGRGLITYDQGLNPGRRAAEKLGVPTAAIERVFGQAEDNTGTLGRELDRAAFTASQRGRLVIALPSTPEAITGLMAWAAGPGATGVAIAPVSALILAPTPVAAEPPAQEPAPEDAAQEPPAPAPAKKKSGNSGGMDSY